MEKLIIDTDIGNDCDDMGALALLDILVEKGMYSEEEKLQILTSLHIKKQKT